MEIDALKFTLWGIKSEKYKGYIIIPTPVMVTSIFKNRTLRERFFTIPFKPLKRYKVVGTKPSNVILKVSDNIYFCHPDKIPELKFILNKDNIEKLFENNNELKNCIARRMPD